MKVLNLNGLKRLAEKLKETFSTPYYFHFKYDKVYLSTAIFGDPNKRFELSWDFIDGMYGTNVELIAEAYMPGANIVLDSMRFPLKDIDPQMRSFILKNGLISQLGPPEPFGFLLSFYVQQEWGLDASTVFSYYDLEVRFYYRKINRADDYT